MKAALLMTVGILASLVAQSHADNPYLKEILMGRCYDHTPEEPCNQVVGSFMNVLESHRASELSEEVFQEAYVDKADLSSPKNKAMIWFEFDDYDGVFRAFQDGGHYWTTPESTVGGRLVEGLIFCTNDNSDCSKESSNAYWKFWNAMYAKFSSSVEGKLVIVIEHPYADATLLRQSVLENLDATKVTSVEIWGVDCGTEIVEKTLPFLKNTQKIPASCEGSDLLSLIEAASKDAPSSKEDSVDYFPEPSTDTFSNRLPSAEDSVDGIQEKSKHHGSFLWIFFGIGVYLYYKRYCYGKMSPQEYDRIKGDVLCPDEENRSGGSRSSGTTVTSGFVNSYTDRNGTY